MEKKNKALHLAIEAGALMMQCGAETYRVEELIGRLCQSSGFERTETFVTPTGLFVSAHMGDQVQTITRRMHERTLDLQRIEELNALSRGYAAGDFGLDEAMHKFDEIQRLKPFSVRTRYLNIAVFGAVFTLLFGGAPADAVAASFLSLLLYLFLRSEWLSSSNYFFRALFGAGIVSAGAQLLSTLIPLLTRDAIVIGTIMQLVPGVAITNSIRDSISGDLLSGLARASEAVFVAIAIALGAALGLFLTGGF